jgi:hypothetical protein
MSLLETNETIDESQLIVPPRESEPEPRPAPGRKTSEDPVWECVADGIWRNRKAKRKKTLFERPKIDGVFTFRSLHTSTVKLAKENSQDASPCACRVSNRQSRKTSLAES